MSPQGEGRRSESGRFKLNPRHAVKHDLGASELRADVRTVNRDGRRQRFTASPARGAVRLRPPVPALAPAGKVWSVQRADEGGEGTNSRLEMEDPPTHDLGTDGEKRDYDNRLRSEANQVMT